MQLCSKRHKHEHLPNESGRWSHVEVGTLQAKQEVAEGIGECFCLSGPSVHNAVRRMASHNNHDYQSTRFSSSSNVQGPTGGASEEATHSLIPPDENFLKILNLPREILMYGYIYLSTCWCALDASK